MQYLTSIGYIEKEMMTLRFNIQLNALPTKGNEKILEEKLRQRFYF